MSNRLNPHPDALSDLCQERLEDYLENLTAPLVGIVPYRQRKAFRQEADAHLEGLIQQYLLEGRSRFDATEAALQEFGNPWKVGSSFLQEWLKGGTKTGSRATIRAATLAAFGVFGTASMAVLLALERQVLDAPRSALSPVIGLLVFIAPFAAGCLIGAIAPAQAERGTRNALGILILHSLVTGLQLLPRYEGLIFALWQLLFWLPCGRVSAGLTALYLCHVRRQRFWRVAR